MALFLRAFILYMLFSLPFVSRSQLVVDTTMSPAVLVEQLLGGEGIQVFNVTFNGLSGDQLHEQIGGFDGTASNIGMDSGLIIATGSVLGALGPNDRYGASLGGGNFDVGDPDLGGITDFFTNDLASLEFDIIAEGSFIGLRCIFGSDEYPEFACSGFSDVIGFFLSGPGVSGPFSNAAENFGLVPYSQAPISINTINAGVPGASGQAAACAEIEPNWQSNAIHYIANGDGISGPELEDATVVQYDGFTMPLWVTHSVVPGETYHLKLAIADVGDTGYDSALFLESGSLISGDFALGITAPTPPRYAGPFHRGRSFHRIDAEHSFRSPYPPD